MNISVFGSIIFFIFIVAVVLNADNEKYIDLGKYGETYNIEETDVMDMIRKAVEKNKDELDQRMREEIRKSVDNYFNVDFDLKHCIVTKDRYFTPETILQHDINLSKYGVFIPANTKFNPLENALFPSYLAFIDTTKKEQIILANKLNQITNGGLFIVVGKGNILDVKDITDEVYKANKPVVRAFKPECMPSVYVQQGNKFLVREFALQKKDGKDSEKPLKDS